MQYMTQFRAVQPLTMHPAWQLSSSPDALSVSSAGLDMSTKTALGFQWQDDPAWLLLDEGLRQVVEGMFHVVCNMRQVSQCNMRPTFTMIVKQLGAWLADQHAKKTTAVQLPLVVVQRLQKVSCCLCSTASISLQSAMLTRQRTHATVASRQLVIDAAALFTGLCHVSPEQHST